MLYLSKPLLELQKLYIFKVWSPTAFIIFLSYYLKLLIKRGVFQKVALIVVFKDFWLNTEKKKKVKIYL